MFRFFRSGDDHPLQSVRSATAWLGELSGQDATARLDRLGEALERARLDDVRPSRDTAAALLHVDAALERDRRQLLDWYVESLGRSRPLADRLWSTANQSATRMASAYGHAFDEALEHSRDRNWRRIAPRLGARAIGLHGFTLVLQMLRGDGAVGSFWTDLHSVFVRSVGTGIVREAAALPGDNPLEPVPLVEHEYVGVLLLGLLGSGNLTPPEIDWMRSRLHTWSRGLVLTSQPQIEEGFVVSDGPTSGLRRWESGMSTQSGAWYLDTSPLVRELVRAMAGYAGSSEDGDGRDRLSTAQRVAALEKSYAAIAARAGKDLRGSQRIDTAADAELRCGLAAIVRELAPAPALPESAAPTQAMPREFQAARAANPRWRNDDRSAFWAGGGERTGAAEAGRSTTLDPAEPPEAATGWRIVDRSETGMRIVGRGSGGPDLTVGSLIAVFESEQPGWRLAVVRRLARDQAGRTVAGVSLMVGNFTGLNLCAVLGGSGGAGGGERIDAPDSVRLGRAFAAILLESATPSAGGAAGAISLILPKAEYGAGRQFYGSGAGDPITLVVRNIVEQQADWVRAALA